MVQSINLTEGLQFPDEEDLSGAADALVRLQKTYNLNVTDISKGMLKGVQFDSQLTADDCFEIGKQSSEIQDYYQSVLWLTEAYRIHSEEMYKTVSKTEILEYLTYALFNENDVMKALALNNELLDADPGSEVAQKNKEIFEEAIQNLDNREFFSDRYQRGIYDEVCSNEVTVDESIRSQLKCRYADYGRPFLKLAKLKEEEVYLRPKIALYHDVLYDEEIQTIQKIMKDKMKRAEVLENDWKTIKSNLR